LLPSILPFFLHIVVLPSFQKVPNSSRKLIEDGDMCIYNVTILKGIYNGGRFTNDEFEEGIFNDYTEQFKRVCREKRFIIRDFEYDPAKQAQKRQVVPFLTELVLPGLMFLTELVLTLLFFLNELVLTVLIFLTATRSYCTGHSLPQLVLTVLTIPYRNLVLTVLTFLTELVLTVLTFLTELVLTVLIFLTATRSYCSDHSLPQLVLTVLTIPDRNLVRTVPVGRATRNGHRQAVAELQRVVQGALRHCLLRLDAH
jgi:hypothetical protein